MHNKGTGNPTKKFLKRCRKFPSATCEEARHSCSQTSIMAPCNISQKLMRLICMYLICYLSVFVLLPDGALTKGGGRSRSGGSRTGITTGGGTSHSRWVFWYYPHPGGGRTCGNICITTFVIIGIILICTLGCVICRCYRLIKYSR